jgi:peptide/nickel transport system ATP-binding protein
VKEFLEGREVAQPEADGAMAFTQKTCEPLMSVRDLEVTYALEKNIFGKTTKELKAVDGFSFDIFEGETLGLVGESGCGKSTLGRTLLRLLDHSSGTITYRGHNLDKLSHSEQHELRRKVQIVFQDPYSSLNPRITIGEAILEPLRCHHLYSSSSERRERVMQLMKQVGLEPEWYNRYPHEFSGGQRQRVCIARALILEPELVVCDESVSALDVSVQAQVLNLLNELKETYGYTYLFITHDLSVVKFLSDRIMVMEKGRLVETAPSDELFAHPQHPYTQRLLSAIPRV